MRVVLWFMRSESILTWETIFVFIYLFIVPSAASRHKSISRLWKVPHRRILKGADAALGRKEDFELSYIILMMQ